MKKIWALVTGEIRSELYLRIVLHKLTRFRDDGFLEGIVLSTWKGSVNKYENLRKQLDDSGIIIKETDYQGIEENVEYEVGFKRQQVTIQKGLDIIPNNKFVLKLRTDFIQDSGPFFERLKDDSFLVDVIRCGNFPVINNYKITLLSHRAEYGFVADDRFFFGYKEDLLKTIIPMNYYRFAECQDEYQANFFHGYAELQYPFLRLMRNILTFEFWERLTVYVSSVTEEEMNLPTVIYRVYATNLLWLRTCIAYAYDSNNHADDIIPLKGFFDCRSGYIEDSCIEKWYEGKVFVTDTSKAFYEQLDLVKRYDLEAKNYTYDEYLELKEFAEITLGNTDLVKPYPISNDQYSYKKVNLLHLGRRDDPVLRKRIEEILEIQSFDCVSETIYCKVWEDVETDINEYKMELMKAAIFDHDSKATLLYLKMVNTGVVVPDKLLYRTVSRNLHMELTYLPKYGVTSQLTLAFFYFMQNMSYLRENNREIYDLALYWLDKILIDSNFVKSWKLEKKDMFDIDHMKQAWNSWLLNSLRKKIGWEVTSIALSLQYLHYYEPYKTQFDVTQIKITNEYKKYTDYLQGLPPNSRLVLYGAGEIGCFIASIIIICGGLVIEKWVDKRHQILDAVISDPSSVVKNSSFDYVLVCTKKKEIVDDILEDLEKYGVDQSKIHSFV